MKRAFVIGLMGVALGMASVAHEFWLLPKKFRFKVGEEMQVAFLVGENFQGEPWNLARHKVERLEVHTGITVKKLADKVRPDKGKNLSYTFDREGTHLLALESNFAFLEQPADSFKMYLEEDGLENILDERRRTGRSGERAREFYKRFAKVIVQCGTKLDNSFRRSAGFRYEIFPLANPVSLKPGDYLDCQVMWEGKPAPHAMVKVWSHVGNRIFLQNIYTEKDGTIRFPVSSPGPWMVSSVKMIPSEQEGADYQSFWASLVFDIQSP
ncbi:MAG: DUF4198 domain-containing protein [Cyclobacteriaceae bacterium]|nr:DUF4198 domain-containing protein [Cyclobacteriaceae bacterium]